MSLDPISPREPPKEPIAIIGIGCRFPGDANDPASFWRLLSTGVDAITEIPEDRWSIEHNYHPVPGVPGKTYARWGGFIKGIDQFEPECFGISPREASYIDPQQRLLLEVAWEALEDGGQVIERLAGTNTGVFVGISTTDYARIQSIPYDTRSIGAHTATGGVMSIAANRISYCLNLRGPSVAIDTACSSALVATHLACQSIWDGECDLALAGGVNIIISADNFIAFCAASMLSPDGRCKAFDASANGFVRSEGAGVVVLKPLSKALADGDPVYALIVGSAVNQDGRTSGLSAPSQTAQEAVLLEACRWAGIDPRQVHYVETHGTGTAIGDPIEANALGNVLSSGRPKGQHCVIGSVKTNIGHLEAAAGTAGLIKAALALKHRMIPPNLHFLDPNPNIPFEELQLRVPQSLEAWPDDSGPAIAGVNSFGFGGTNAHILMMEYQRGPEDPAAVTSQDAAPALLLPLSARTPEALQKQVRSYQDFLGGDSDHSDMSVADLCYTAGVRRMHFDHRLSLVIHNREELLECLEAFLAGERRPGMVTGRRMPGHVPKLAFVFGGQGPQWWAMGRELLENEPVFRQTIERCDALLRQHADWSLLAELTADEACSRLQETAIAQPALFALQVALAALWKSWGVEPEAAVGHSVGEVAAAHIAGALRLEDAVRVIFHRGRCMDLASSKGKMLAVGLSMLEAEQAIQGYEDRVSVAAINSPSSATLSGDPQALEQISRALDAKGVFCRFLRVNYAFHSPQMEPIQDELLVVLNSIDVQPTVLPMISTVTGRPVEDGQCDKRYWWQNVRQSVRFAEAVDWLSERGYDTFVELSPHPILSGSVSECLQQRGRQGTVLPSLRRQEAERATMLASLGTLYTLGHPVDWRKLWLGGGRCVYLPSYPWQRQHYWHELEELREVRLGRHTHPLLGRPMKSADPAWETAMDKRSMCYLEDHRVQGHAVFPAAAYVEMALGAARESFGGGVYNLEGVRFQKVLFLPDSGETPTVQLVFYPADASFAIYSRMSSSDQSWTLHASGDMHREEDLASPPKVDLKAVREHLPNEVSDEEHYRRVAELGFYFGPSFQGIERLWRKDGEALGQVRIPEHLAQESTSYCVHPAFLDACFQVLSGTIPLDNDEIKKLPYLPVQVERLHFYASPGSQVWCHAQLTNFSANTLEGDICVYDEDGNLLIECEGFRCQAVKMGRGDDVDDMENWFYEVKWQHKPRPEQQVAHRAADFIPDSREIAQAVAREVRQLDEESGWTKMFSRMEEPFEILSTAYIVQALHDLGWPWKLGDRVTVDALMEQLTPDPRHQRLMRRFMQILQKAGYLKSAGADTWVVVRLPPRQDPQKLWQSTLSQYPALFADLSLIGRCGSHLAPVLRGEIEPLHLLFPEGSAATTEHFYQDSPGFRPYNILAQKAVSRALSRLPEGRPVRILEVGAGVGGMTAYVLPGLPANRTEYVFSDVASLFLAKAEQKFRDYPFVQFRALDIETDPLQQGYEPHTFDLILASDVLHATGDLRETLRNILTLLSSEGLLLFLEVEKAPSWVDLVFGLTEGWWRFRDYDLRPDYPLLTRNEWKNLLQEVGLTDVAVLSLSPGDEASFQVVMLARGPHIQAEAQNAEPETDVQPAKGEQGRWLIFADRGGVARKLAHLLTLRGEACTVVTAGNGFQRLNGENFQISPNNPEDMERLVWSVSESQQPAWRGVIHLWSLDIPQPGEPSIDSLQLAEVLGCYCIMHLMQALDKIERRDESFQLVLVTRRAQPIGNRLEAASIGQSPLLGLGRVIINEFPDISCKMVDLGPDDGPDEVQSLFEELWTEDPEEEVALRYGARFVPRLEPMTREKVSAERSASGATKPFRLEISASGVIDDLTLRETRRQRPGPGQVEIEVCAASLNFRDVMKALGLYPTDGGDYMMLGDECAGRIVAVGEGVEGFQAGDEVIAIAPGSLGSHVTTLAAFVMPKPAHLTFEEAATIPVVFLTAHYALHHMARIRAGERVLIHSATGGVGLAALQIAQHVGAEVFATAGSPEKRELLQLLGAQHVMDSRSLSFADHIMEITGGQGVDIVLNSLAGKAIAKGISCLAAYGRFLELGKRDIYQNSKLGLWGFRKNVSFFAIDLGGLLTEKPTFIKALFSEVSERIVEQTFHPLPHRVFPVSRIGEAFRHMAQARHIGKIVISMHEQGALIDPLDEESFAFRPDASYLITGGFGGLGLTLARWIIEHGGRNVVLMGRSGAASDEARKALEDLQTTGARVMAARADITDEKQLADVLADIDRTMPPLRGLFHTAMVLDDGILLQLDQARFRKVMAPKVDGAWNLHAQTLDRPLDFFVLFSSGSSLIGNPGQANYVAANAFLDAFAYYRRSLGLPAMTINWGLVAETGYVSRQQGLSELMTSRGFVGLSPQQVLDTLDRTLQRQPIQMGVMRMDWQKISSSISTAGLSQRFSSLVSTSSLEQQGGEEGSHIREGLLRAKPEEREEIVQTYIREQVARVLGASASKLDADRPLNDLGLDSLMGIELRNRVEGDLALSLPMRELMQSPTINSLSRAVLGQLALPGSTPSAPPPTDQGTAEQLSAEVGQLSDEEVDSLLREMVGEEADAVTQIEEEMKG
jgi:acyl transferase domain-containing protein/NADPH:quinone reductase-like Zn-dependent oxidoreductase/SAM-dependent methyltransferase/aryl carrier-like protein